MCTGVERRRIYDIVNVLESVGVSDFCSFSFHFPQFLQILIGVLMKLFFFVGFNKKSEESVYVERIFCDSSSIEGAAGEFLSLHNSRGLDH